MRCDSSVASKLPIPYEVNGTDRSPHNRVPLRVRVVPLQNLRLDLVMLATRDGYGRRPMPR